MSKTIPIELRKRMNSKLLQCSLLNSPKVIESLFELDERITPWKNQIDFKVGEKIALILSIMATLYDKNNIRFENRNALALFIEVLTENLSEGDQLSSDLLILRDEWENHLNNSQKEQKETRNILARLDEEQFDTFMDTMQFFIKELLVQQLEEFKHANHTFENTKLIDAVYTHLSNRYGMGYERLDIAVTIHSDGSATICRRILVRAYAQIEDLAIYILSPERDMLQQNRDLKSLSEKHEVELVYTNSNSIPHKRTTNLHISPPLKMGQELEFELSEFVKSETFAINFTIKELEEREVADEYVGWNITRPTKKMTIQVNFPREFIGYKINPEPLVVYALTTGNASESKQIEEQKRILLSHADEKGKHICIMKVDYPVVGLIYQVKWQPRAVDE